MSYETAGRHPRLRAAPRHRTDPETGAVSDEDLGRVDFVTYLGTTLATVWVDHTPQGYVVIVQDIEHVKQHEVPLGQREAPTAGKKRRDRRGR